ncbi:nucleotide exchange factor GrpE [Patescibacteria group bacterium]|nr:nucleotide exchange factor GrpE [Patescibacteria group bacterium]
MKKKNEEKEAKKDELKQKYEELENLLKRTLADYQNLEKRVSEDREQWLKMANKQLLLRLLPALDSLMLAEKHTKDQGVALSVKAMIDALKAEGVEKIEVTGKDFDPNLMECVQVVEGKEDGKVVEELKAGFALYGKVLRPAQVSVGKS